MTTNTVTKAVVAAAAGGRRFALQTIPGLLLVIGAAWAGTADGAGWTEWYECIMSAGRDRVYRCGE